MSDENPEDSTTEPSAEAASAKAQTDADAKLAEANAKAQSANEARIRAEAERDVYQKTMADAKSAVSGQVQWTDEQWSEWEQKSGITRAQLSATQQVADQQINAKLKEFDARAAKAEERAAKAEERAARLEAGQTYASAKGDYLAGKPALARYSKDIDEFLAQFPEAERRDPERLKVLLPMAETFVKGKVGEKMQRPSGGGSPRFESSSDSGITETPGVDVSDLEEGEARLIRSIMLNPEQEKRLAEFSAKRLGREGVAISAQAEWKDAEKDLKRRV